MELLNTLFLFLSSCSIPKRVCLSQDQYPRGYAFHKTNTQEGMPSTNQEISHTPRHYFFLLHHTVSSFIIHRPFAISHISRICIVICSISAVTSPSWSQYNFHVTVSGIRSTNSYDWQSLSLHGTQLHVLNKPTSYNSLPFLWREPLAPV